MSDKIKVEKLDDKELENYSGLTEIKDSKLLGHLSAAVTPLMNTGFALGKIFHEHSNKMFIAHIPAKAQEEGISALTPVKGKPGFLVLF